MYKINSYLFQIFSIILCNVINANTIMVPSDYQTIQEAIDASSEGDSIAVTAGTYFENIDFLGKNIKVVGDNVSNTIIDGTFGIAAAEFPNGGFENGMELWNEYSINNNYNIEATGDAIYGSEVPFEAYEGQHSLKMWGSLYQGENNTSWVGRPLNWEEMGLDPGATITFDGVMMSHVDDWIGQGSNWAALVVYIDNNPYYSETIEAGDSQSEWLSRAITVTLPDNIETLWIGVEFYHASIEDHGSVYVDDLNVTASADIVFGINRNVVKFQNGESRDALLKNFTITNGHASGSWPENQGGGVLIINGSSPTLENIEIINNFAESNGGGISAQDNCSPLIQNVFVRNNQANGNGGGIYLHNQCDALIIDSDISGNIAQNYGGGVYARDESNLVITGSSINDNHAETHGGGLYIENAMPFIFKDSDVHNNIGGGIEIQNGSRHQLSNISVDGNQNRSGLTAYYVENWQASGLTIVNNEVGISIDGGHPIITNSVVANNMGLGAELWNVKLFFVNCVIAHNDGWFDGNPTEIRFGGNSRVYLENSIVWGSNDNNSADMYDSDFDSNLDNTNTVRIGYAILRTSNIQMNEENIHYFGTIINEDPQFIDPENNEFEIILGSSPGVDNGNPSALYNDTDGSRNNIGNTGGRGLFMYAEGHNPNDYNHYNTWGSFLTSQFNSFYMGFSAVDLGNRTYTVHLINNSNNELVLNEWTTTNNQFKIEYWDPNYTDEEITSLGYLPLAINPMSDSNIDGQYWMGLSFSPAVAGDVTGNINLVLDNGYDPIVVDLGLQGTGYQIPDEIIRVPEDVPNIQFALDFSEWNDTIKVGSGTYEENLYLNTKEIYLVGDKDNWPTLVHNPNNGFHSVFEIHDSYNVLIKNFIIENGKGTWIGGNEGPDGDNYVGGGFFLNGKNSNDIFNPRLENLIIQNNSAGYGGGIFSIQANPIISNCIIRNNTTGDFGDTYGDQGLKGGGIYFMSSGNEYWTEIKNTKIISNYAFASGGVHFHQNGEKVLLENVLIADNYSQLGASGIHSSSSAINMINSTIANNQTNDSLKPGGLYVSNDGGAIVVNTIFSDNSPYDIGVFTNNEHSDVIQISHSILSGGAEAVVNNDVGTLVWADGNIEEGADLDVDYSLLGYSVGIGDGSSSGTLSSWSYNAPLTDIVGAQRPNPEGTNPDIGAFENSLGVSQYQIQVDSVNFIHGDTALLPINNISILPLSAIELRIAGYQGILDFIDIVDDEGTHFGDLGWMTVYNNTDTLLITASAGFVPITTSGTLFKLKLAVPEDLESQFVPITIIDFVGNESITDYYVIDGGVQSVWGPEVDFTVDVTNGPYPLEVNFSDQSISGTFPINEWNWFFGNDSGSNEQNPTFTYLYPGEYDISLVIEDEFTLLDTISYESMIQVDTLWGDLTFNTLVQSYDASLILRNLVDLEPLNSLQSEIGDVSLNDTLSALDAYYILQYMVGLIDTLPYIPDEYLSSGGNFVMDDVGAEPGMIIDVPIRIENAFNFNAFKASIVYDQSVFSLDTVVFADYLNNYLIEYNKSNLGEVKIAATGNQPSDQNGIIANVSFLVLDGFDSESAVRLESVMVNENRIIEVGAEMMVSYVLGINSNPIPDSYYLHQNYPNPFNPITKISYDLPEETSVEISIFDLMGRNINTLLNEKQSAGYRSIIWNGKNMLGKPVAGGVYIYVIEAGNFRQTKKMVLLN